jgi:hypothetical protein
VIKGFFLDRINVLGNELSVGMGVEGSTAIFPDIADAEFPVGDQAVVTAQKTRCLTIFQLFIK